MIKQINDVVVRIKKGPQAKPKVVHVNRLKPYAGEEHFGWFVGKDTSSRISLDSSVDKSNLPGATTTPNDNDDGAKISEAALESLRRGKRIRKQPQRYTPSNCSTGTDELGRGQCSARV